MTQHNSPNYHLQNLNETGDVNVNTLVPICGVCCFIVSLVPGCFSCLGCVSESTLCCFSFKQVLCKPSVEPGSYCKMCFIECDIDPFTTFLSSRSQCLILDCRIALPNNETVPCICNAAGLTCCFESACKCSCCSNIEALYPKLKIVHGVSPRAAVCV